MLLHTVLFRVVLPLLVHLEPLFAATAHLLRSMIVVMLLIAQEWRKAGLVALVGVLFFKLAIIHVDLSLPLQLLLIQLVGIYTWLRKDVLALAGRRHRLETHCNFIAHLRRTRIRNNVLLISQSHFLLDQVMMGLVGAHSTDVASTALKNVHVIDLLDVALQEPNLTMC